MKVIIPVAGVGKRLKPHTITQPKPLLYVAGKPILASILDPILKLDVDEYIFVIGFMGKEIRKYIEKNYSFKATFVEQDRLLGLGYAIHLALEKAGDDPVLIVLGDTIVQCDLGEFVGAGNNVLGLRQVDDPHRFGIAEIDGERITGVEEKPSEPKTDLALIGLYYIEDSAALRNHLHANIESDHRTNGEIQLTDALQAMITNGTTFVPYIVEEWHDCGKKETMLATNRHLLQNMGSTPTSEGSTFIPPVFVAPGSKVTNSTIGPNVSISHDVLIANCTIKNSIVAAGSRVEDSKIEDSLLGRNTVVRRVNGILNLGDSSEVDC